MSGDAKDYRDVFDAVSRHVWTPCIRIYITGNKPLKVDEIAKALPEYEVSQRPGNSTELLLIRRAEITAEDQFTLECERIAALLVSISDTGSSLTAMYDDRHGNTAFIKRIL